MDQPDKTRHASHYKPPDEASKKRTPTCRVPVGTLMFDSIREYEFKTRLCRLPENCSPCLRQDELIPEDDGISLGYEVWCEYKHKYGPSADVVQIDYCRCQCARKMQWAPSHTGGQEMKRHPKVSGRVSTKCPATRTVYKYVDGRVKVQYRNYHNHRCDSKFAHNFVNPLRHDSHVAVEVDIKLRMNVY